MTRSEIAVADGVTRLWPTPVVLARVPVEPKSGVGVPSLSSLFNLELPNEDSLARYVRDPDEVANLFLRAMQHLDAAADPDSPIREPVSGTELNVELWPPGYENPVVTTTARYIGWYVLESTHSEHVDSGTICIMDPRAGCDRTAVPGLPWGRHLMIQPVAGTFVVAPGWIMASVLPMERDQAALVVTARSIA